MTDKMNDDWHNNVTDLGKDFAEKANEKEKYREEAEKKTQWHQDQQALNNYRGWN
ncbi:hypothetical protein [Paenibacillus bouchesdurhonensis]|uniref:hypothetical protein n=1 Tax=Paenibacillus bouchesdurhonensis TaxID=1870990 RepID=UPI0019025205|nr:hypothetical protein [Paenibacillus bouchesdurhonensis]